ncbi:hypothetical protein SAMN05519103_07170 [Rhizobiales bacterium GAS113]|jgi:environmental stress-induced protein Ves|nr:hypothetical protein SAMN05519103_07170 [Rhizobiales bacterium GAS113]
MHDPGLICERLDPLGYRRAPWKNGGGVTVDIAAGFREGARAGDWDGLVWRFGRTRIERPGPFSDLAGFDRSLSVIAGKGLVLKPAEAPPINVREPFRPVCFPGEWRIESELESGSVGVLNLMTDRRLAHGEVRFLRDRQEMLLEAEIVIVYAPSGAAGFALGGETMALGDDEALRINGRKPVPIRHERGKLAIACVTLILPGLSDGSQSHKRQS